jgi:O-antigen ligase
MNGIATGAIAAGIRALWDQQVTGYERAFEWMMPIQGGDISMSLGLLSLCGVMWAIKTSSYRHLFYFSIASIMGLLGSILSGSRGGWVLFPVILFVGYRIFRDWFSTQIKWSMALALCLLISFCLMPQSGVPQRISQAKNDVQLYFTGENKVTSLGHRFEIWKSSIDSFIKKPVFGWGNHGVRLSQEQQYKSGLITKAAYDFNGHAHNQFFDEMAKRGIIGLSALLALFLFPLTIFKRQLANATLVEDKTLAACGVVLVLSTIDYCLSQAFLNHNSGIVFYCLTAVLFYTAQHALSKDVKSV